ncbi:MAG TPA: aldolase/citrate lyase family protein [Syntrophales bacterium]|nr:aldolase/citrate lyase family protein [Syntrophales bacterium]
MPVRKLREGKSVAGTMVRMVKDPAVAWMAHHAGLGYIMLDLEHGSYTLETVGNIFKVGRALGLGCFARVPELSRGYVSRIMDAGATGVMVPMLESVEQARQFVAWSKYAPLGDRGFGTIGDHTTYASVGPEFMARSNDETLSIAQIETRRAVEEVDAIAAVPGIDALLVGPNDLSVSLGCAGDLLGDQLEKAIGRVAEAAKKHGKIFGLHGPDALLERWIPRGCSLIMSSLDISILSAGLKAIAQKFKA